MSYAGTLTTVYFLAGLSILVSVHSRRPREAIAVLYVYELVWLVVPTLLITRCATGPRPGRRSASGSARSCEYVAITSPLYL